MAFRMEPEKGSAIPPGARRRVLPAEGSDVRQGIRCRPRSGHRAAGDTRITTDRRDRERGATATAVWSRTAGLPPRSVLNARTADGVAGRACPASVGSRAAAGPRIYRSRSQGSRLISWNTVPDA
ncbi:hypothetical protein GCM10018777_61300 [Streptomyces albogriseolus]|nr:hypothetical protein GCM10018777_61300 [Streptomyces viridodiastaticus]